MGLFGINEHFSYVDIKYFGDLGKCFQIRLYGVGTPFGNRCWVFAKLLNQPLSLLVNFGKHSLYPIEFNDFHIQLIGI